MDVVFEDNHIIIVNKAPGEIVQADKTGDRPLSESVKDWIKEKYSKPGNVFLGVVHRLDRPVGGLVVFARTSKALTRMNELFRQGDVHKTYWAITRNRPPEEAAELCHTLVSVERNNKTYIARPGDSTAKECRLRYRRIASTDHYHLLEINLLTGRKHQIRAQLAAIGCPIKGDLKYGDKRSNPDGSISLMAKSIDFIHPVSGKHIHVDAPIPMDDNLWRAFANAISANYSDKQVDE